MASLVFENKVKAWEKSRLEVRKYISDPQFAEQDGYFSEVEQMAFGGSFKKKELDERIMQLKPFARGIANKDPKLSGALNLFLSLCETLYGNGDFEAVARRLKLASDLLKIARDERARPSGGGNARRITEEDAARWDVLANGLWTKVRGYEKAVFDFLCVLFYVAEVRRDNPSANLRSLMLFANQISAKDAIVAGEIQRFAGLADKYVKNGKMGEFRQSLRTRSTYLRLEELCRQIDLDIRKKEDERRRAEEREAKEREKRRRIEAEERARRERAERFRKRMRHRIKVVLGMAAVVLAVVLGVRYFDMARMDTKFDEQMAVGDRWLAEKDYGRAVAEYRKALQIDSGRAEEVNGKEAYVQSVMRAEFGMLLDELRTILKADRNRFNDDSGQRLDRMLEIFPEDEAAQRYQRMRERQQKGRRKY